MESSETLAKRNIKDSVFTHLFKDPAYTIQLYRALHPEDTTSTEKDVSILTLENILLNQPYNDLGFAVGDRLLVFVEAQSTWSDNILVRGLLYMAQTIQNYLMETQQNIYGSSKVKFPSPEFYVLFTGDKKDRPSKISLTKEFFGGKQWDIEVTASILYDGNEGDIINQYVTFTKIYQEQCNIYNRTRTAITETIRICKDKNVLKEYLLSRETEVIDIMTYLFNQEYATEAYGREQRAEGKAEGRAESARETALKMKAKGYDINEIVDLVNVSIDTVRQWLNLPVGNGTAQ